MKNLILFFAVLFAAITSYGQDVSFIVVLEKWQVAPVDAQQIRQVDSLIETGATVKQIVCTSSRAGSVTANNEIANKRAQFYGEKYNAPAIALPYTDSLGANEASNRVAIFVLTMPANTNDSLFWLKDNGYNANPDSLIFTNEGADVIVKYAEVDTNSTTPKNDDTPNSVIQLDTLPTPQILAHKSQPQFNKIQCDCTKELAYATLARYEYEVTAEVWKNGLNKHNRKEVRKQMYKTFGRWKYNQKVYKRCMYFAGKNKKAQPQAQIVTTNYNPNKKGVSFGQSKKTKRFYPQRRKNGVVFRIKSKLACKKGTRM
jgi:hypothetical protein